MEKEKEVIGVELVEVKAKDMRRQRFREVDLGLPSGRLWADRNVGAPYTSYAGYYMPIMQAVKNRPDGWRIPGHTEFAELLDCTTRKWCQLSGRMGLRFTGSNGNSIFLPAAGTYNGEDLFYRNRNGIYLSSSFVNEKMVYDLMFLPTGFCDLDLTQVRSFFTVRLVKDRP